MMSTAPVVIQNSRNPGCLLQILWFALVGWWLGQAWMVVAWVFMVSIVGMPIGIAMFNALPKIIALREPPYQVTLTRGLDGKLVQHEVPQMNFLIRAIYFVLVGWWASALWLEAGYALCATVIGLPVGFWMFDQVPMILTLKR